jgi:hypothetical protein
VYLSAATFEVKYTLVFRAIFNVPPFSININISKNGLSIFIKLKDPCRASKFSTVDDYIVDGQ